MKLVSKLMIALLLVAFVGQASASFFAVCQTSETNTLGINSSSISLIKLSHANIMADATPQQLDDCEQGHCACQEHACSNIFSLASNQSKINQPAPNTKIPFHIPAWHDAEQHSLLRPPIFS